VAHAVLALHTDCLLFVTFVCACDQAVTHRFTSDNRQMTPESPQVALLAAEERPDDEVAAVLHTSRSTVERIRRGFVEHGLEAASSERPRLGWYRSWMTADEPR
jgi:hypothetical protein